MRAVSDVAEDHKAGYSAGDAWHELGAARKQAAFDVKTSALTESAKFATARGAALGVVKTATESALKPSTSCFTRPAPLAKG